MTQRTPSAPTTIDLSALQCCPLCRALNAAENTDCFVCGWHGQFDRHPQQVLAAFEALVERCPELSWEVELTDRRRDWRRFGRQFSAWFRGTRR